jgi:hypothetical protein
MRAQPLKVPEGIGDALDPAAVGSGAMGVPDGRAPIAWPTPKTATGPCPVIDAPEALIGTIDPLLSRAIPSTFSKGP